MLPVVSKVLPQAAMLHGRTSDISLPRRKRIKEFLHEWIVDRDDKDFAGILQLRRVDVAGDMCS